MTAVLIWLISAAAIAGVLFRPKGWPEAVWACSGAILLIAFRLISTASAAGAAAKGIDVYLFLAGMMLVAELARREGVFDWMAGLAVRACRGSGMRLFALIYAVGIGVTVFLSNDATAVVLTPAVYAAVKKARAEARPYLFACAFIANAASFVLPISNPANLVVYQKTLPPLLPWLRVFALPSLLSIAATFLILRWVFKDPLAGAVAPSCAADGLSGAGRRAAWGIAGTAAVLIAASGLNFDLGLPACVAGICAVLAATRAEWRWTIRIIRGVSWSVLPFVAGLFVLVEAMDEAGASRGIGAAFQHLGAWPAWAGTLGASFGAAALSNMMNNLPSGLLIGGALGTAHASARLRDAVMIGVDLGPNLSVTGSLATVLWLIALRREGEKISGWAFLKAGAAVMIPALLLASLALLV